MVNGLYRAREAAALTMEKSGRRDLAHQARRGEMDGLWPVQAALAALTDQR
jgi:hypothetical protein